MAMTEHWLTNKTRFCINENYQTENDGRCYWGLPSISADDPTFPPLGYWRGYVWCVHCCYTRVVDAADHRVLLWLTCA